jgi:stage V sporulation protein S
MELSKQEQEAVLGKENDCVLRVKASSPPSNVASAIAHAVYDDQKVVLRAIGAGAVNQAAKAIAIARSYVAQRGIDLSCRPGFASTVSNTGDELSVMTFLILVN